MASLQGSAPNTPMRNGSLPQVDAHVLGDLGDVERVGRRGAQHVGAEILQQRDLPLGAAAGHRHDRAAEPLGAVMRAEAAGEQAVAVGVVHDVAGPRARRRRASAPSGPPTCRDRPWCSRRRSACRSCPRRRAGAAPARAARRTGRTDSCRADRVFTVKGNRAMSASDLKSLGLTPAASNFRGNAGPCYRRARAWS